MSVTSVHGVETQLHRSTATHRAGPTIIFSMLVWHTNSSTIIIIIIIHIIIIINSTLQLASELHNHSRHMCISERTRMWANAQRDGRPAEYGWRPVQRSKVWLTVLKCYAVTTPKRESHWNLMGCPNLTKQSQPLVGRSSPYCANRWRIYCCLTSFFRLLINALVAKIQPGKVVRCCTDCNFLHHFCVLYFQWAACSTFQTCILNLH